MYNSFRVLRLVGATELMLRLNSTATHCESQRSTMSSLQDLWYVCRKSCAHVLQSRLSQARSYKGEIIQFLMAGHRAIHTLDMGLNLAFNLRDLGYDHWFVHGGHDNSTCIRLLESMPDAGECGQVRCSVVLRAGRGAFLVAVPCMLPSSDAVMLLSCEIDMSPIRFVAASGAGCFSGSCWPL